MPPEPLERNHTSRLLCSDREVNELEPYSSYYNTVVCGSVYRSHFNMCTQILNISTTTHVQCMALESSTFELQTRSYRLRHN